MRIITVVGARPQFIKAAMVSQAIADRFGKHTEAILHTGQHFDHAMSDVFFQELGMGRPKFNLGIGGGTHGQNTGHMIEAIEGILINEKPDVVIVYGDTDSTLAGALAAAKMKVILVHIEAGLRSFDRGMPEEINRVVSDHISDILFAPTKTSVTNLVNEGITLERIFEVGDVMFDAALHYGEFARPPDSFRRETPFVLATIHRAGNVDNPSRLQRIFRELKVISKEIPVVFPAHPRTNKHLAQLNIDCSELLVIPPASYFEMLWLLRNSQAVITDSGGVQKEASFFRKPCILARAETEWVELVESGHTILADLDIKSSLFESLATPSGEMDPKLFGQGNASRAIAKILGQELER